MSFYGSSLMAGEKLPEGNSVVIEGMDQPVVVHKDGMAIMGSDGKMVSFFELNLVKMFRGSVCL